MCLVDHCQWHSSWSLFRGDWSNGVKIDCNTNGIVVALINKVVVYAGTKLGKTDEFAWTKMAHVFVRTKVEETGVNIEEIGVFAGA